MIKTIFLSLANSHSPLKQTKIKSTYSPWITEKIKYFSYRRNILKKKVIKHNSAYYVKEYKQCRNNLKKTIKETKSNYYKSKFNAYKDHKENWKEITE